MKDVRFVKGADHKNSDATTMTCRRMNIWNIQGQYCSFRLAYTGVLVWPDDIASGFVSLWEDCAKRHSTVRDREEQHSTYLSVIGWATPHNALNGSRFSSDTNCMNLILHVMNCAVRTFTDCDFAKLCVSSWRCHKKLYRLWSGSWAPLYSQISTLTDLLNFCSYGCDYFVSHEKTSAE